MEQPSYLNVENEEKAKKVRQLINKYYTTKLQKDRDENWLPESDRLSTEIREYLSSTFPNSFKSILAEMNLNTGIPIENSLQYLTTIFSPHLDNIPLHTIIIFVRQSFDFSVNSHFPKIYYKFLGVLFQTENGSDFLRFDEYNSFTKLRMPTSFYNLLEKLGLKLEQAAKLYKLEEKKPDNKFHTIYLKEFEFPWHEECWPGEVNILD